MDIYGNSWLSFELTYNWQTRTKALQYCRLSLNVDISKYWYSFTVLNSNKRHRNKNRQLPSNVNLPATYKGVKLQNLHNNYCPHSEMKFQKKFFENWIQYCHDNLLKFAFNFKIDFKKSLNSIVHYSLRSIKRVSIVLASLELHVVCMFAMLM